MANFKKILCFILALSLCVGLCACGALEKADERLNIRLKGNNSGKLRLSVFTELPEGYETKYAIGTGMGESPLVIKEKAKKGTLKYTITKAEDAESGMHNVSIYYENPDGDVYASIRSTIAIGEDGKIVCYEIIPEGRDAYIPIADSSEESLIPENSVVSNYTANVKEVKLANGNGNWLIKDGSYDSAVVDTEYIFQEEEPDCSCFRLTALSVGVSDIVFYNDRDMIQLKMSLAVTVNEDEEDNGAEQYILTITDSQSSEYDKTQTQEYYEEQMSAAAMLRHCLPDAFIPAEASFDNCYVYNYDNVDFNFVDFTDYKAAAAVYNDAPAEEKEAAKAALDAMFIGCNAANLTFEYEGEEYSYLITTARDTEALMNDIMLEVEHSDAKELKAGGKTASYVIANDGFGAAVFSDGNYYYALLGLDEFTDEVFSQVLETLLSMPNAV